MICTENGIISNEDVAKILDNIPLNVIVTDILGNIIWCNKTACDFTGYNKIEMIGENPRILKCDKNDPEIYKELWVAITKKEIWAGTLTNKKKNGEIYEEELIIIPLLDEHGNINKFVGIQRDVTELDKLRKRDNIKKAIANAVEKIAQMNESRE